MGKLKKWVFIFFLFSVSSAAALFALDWVLAHYFLKPTRIAVCARKLPSKIKIFNPKCSGDVYHPDYGHIPYRTNSMGMRDKNYARSVYAGGGSSLKVLIAGDSFTFGAGVRDGRMYHSLLESRRPELVFFNAGYGGFGIQEEEKVINYFVPKTNPNLVLVAFLPNDLIDLKVGKQSTASAMDKFRLLRNVAALVRDHLLPQKLLLVARGVISEEWNSIYKRNLDDKAAKRYRLFIETILKIQVSLKRGDSPVPLALLLIPQVEQVNGYLDSQRGLSARAPFDHIRRKLKGSGIAVLDSLPHFLRQKSPGRLYYPGDRHLTELGHKVLADFLEQRVAGLKRLAKGGANDQ